MEALGFFIGSLELKLKPPFPMITKEELQYWHEGIVHYTKGDLNTALELFQNAGPYSKLWFNIGMIYSRTNDHDSAEIMYSKAIEQDEYMAVGYLQKGYASFMLYDYVAAIKCFQYALSLLLDNDFIDYEQLGLKHRLYRCELLYNLGICYELVGSPEANRFLSEASNYIRTPAHEALIQGSRQSSNITLFRIPYKSLFELSESKIKNLEKKNFLKDAKLVISNDTEGFIGFTGASILDPELEKTTTTLVRVPKNGDSVNTLPRIDTKQRRRTNSFVLNDLRDTLPRSNTSNNPIETLQNVRSGSASSNRSFQTTKSRGNRQESLSRRGTDRNQISPTTSINSRVPQLTNRRPSDQRGLNVPIRTRKGSLPANRSFDQPKNYNTSPVSPTTFVRSDRSGSGSDSGYEDGEKLKIKVHAENATKTIFGNQNMSLQNLTNKIQTSLKLKNLPSLAFIDEEDPDTLISITDDDDLYIALNADRSIVHLYIQRSHESLLDFY